ncbi:MAG TPA: hypothetical protein VFE03_13790 [Caulobacteraceae bacterium]|jgi:hypothetical protein|nr:hypothetical protein [Caulobacteraceae bacterium]
MAQAAPEFVTRLEPQDEYCHTPDAAQNYNESMYFNVFDHTSKAGGWFRIGNRPNEGYAEMSVCLYLPDGRIGFMFGRPKIGGNTELNAGGLKIEVVEPFKRLKVTYSGKVCLMENPADMADPSTAFSKNPNLPCTVELDYEGVSPMMGGETVRADGKPMQIDAEKSFARAHYEQHVNAKGSFQIGEERFEIDGYGLRDKSWGPRYWSAINWYRWCPLNFGPDFGMMLSVIAGAEGKPREGGMVFRDGAYDYISECKLSSDWDEAGYQTALRASVKTRGGKAYEVTGKVLSLIPLRNRRKTPDGGEVVTRITEGMTEYHCDGKVGYGLSEYLDQIIDGQPTGKAFEEATTAS